MIPWATFCRIFWITMMNFLNTKTPTKFYIVKLNRIFEWVSISSEKQFKCRHRIMKMETLMMTKHWPNCQQYLSKIIPKGKCYFHIKNYHFSFLLAFLSTKEPLFSLNHHHHCRLLFHVSRMYRTHLHTWMYVYIYVLKWCREAISR